MYCITLKSGHQRDRKDQKSSTQIHNAEILDENKADDPVLDIAAANVDDDATVSDNCDNNYNQYHRTLKCPGKYENLDKLFLICEKTFVSIGREDFLCQFP